MEIDLVKIKDNLLNILLPKRMSPKLAVINKLYTSSGKGTYCYDVEIVRPGDLERTGKCYKEVPVSPIWAGKKKQGIYCPIEKDIVVILNFINWDEAFPYVEGIYADQYETVEHPENEFLITNGEVQEIRLKKDILINKNDKLSSTYDMTSGSETIDIKDEVNTNELKMSSQGLKASSLNSSLDLSSLIELKNSVGSLKSSLADLWDIINDVATITSSLSTSGSSTAQTAVAGQFTLTIAAIQIKKQLMEQIFK